MPGSPSNVSAYYENGVGSTSNQSLLTKDQEKLKDLEFISLTEVNGLDLHSSSEIVNSSATPLPTSTAAGRNAYKNLFFVSTSFFIIFGVYLAEISLQSSINEDSGLGLTSLCVVYFFFALSSLLSSTVIGFLGTKYTMVLSYCGMTVYTLTNFYPSWYTLIPGSVVIGLIFGPLWASQAVYVTDIANQYASRLGKKSQEIVFIFLGIYCFSFKIAYVPSNVISSVVLLNGRSPNTSVVDSALPDICNNTEAANLDRIYWYILLSIYTVLDVLAIALLIIFVDRIKTEAINFSSVSSVFNNHVKKPVVNTLKLFLSWKLNSTVAMMILDGYSISVVFGVFARVYISDCIGVFWIGFCQISFGVGSAVSAIINGYMAKIIPLYIMVYIGASVNVSVVCFLLVWQRQPSYHIIFIVLFFWGCSEGLWNSIPISVVGTVLSHMKKESAQSYARLGKAGGFVIGFLVALFFDIKAVLWIDLGLLTSAVICFSVLMFVTQPKNKLLPCCFKKNEDTNSSH